LFNFGWLQECVERRFIRGSSDEAMEREDDITGTHSQTSVPWFVAYVRSPFIDL
jgi:hypothetical protein